MKEEKNARMKYLELKIKKFELMKKQVIEIQRKIRSIYSDAYTAYMEHIENDNITPSNIHQHEAKRLELYAAREAYLNCLLLVDSIIGGK